MKKAQVLEYMQWLGITIGIIAAVWGIYTNWVAHRRFKEADAILNEEMTEQERETVKRFWKAGYAMK